MLLTTLEKTGLQNPLSGPIRVPELLCARGALSSKWEL